MKDPIISSPRFAFVNLKFDEKTGMLSKIYKDGRILQEDAVRNADIGQYLKTEHILPVKAQKDFEMKDFCIESPLARKIEALNLKLGTGSSSLGKISLFFDNSASADRSNAKRYYDAIYKAIKNHDGAVNDVDLYSFNFSVDKLISLEGLEFYGYSDIDRLMEYVMKNALSGQRIIFVTDDDHFNLSTIENKAADYSSVLTDQISVLKIGSGVKSYKQEISNLLSATDGNIYGIDSEKDIEPALGKIFSVKRIESDLRECKAEPGTGTTVPPTFTGAEATGSILGSSGTA